MNKYVSQMHLVAEKHNAIELQYVLQRMGILLYITT